MVRLITLSLVPYPESEAPVVPPPPWTEPVGQAAPGFAPITDIEPYDAVDYAGGEADRAALLAAYLSDIDALLDDDGLVLLADIGIRILTKD